MSAVTSEGGDPWARWLLGTRHSGDAALRERMLADTLYPVARRDPEPARLAPGDTLTGAGCAG
jgi:hypothetical protein